MLNFRILLAILHDLLAVAAAWLIAYWLRFNLELPEPYNQQAWTSVLWVVPLYGVIFFASGLYRGIWRFASLPDLQRIILAVGGGALAAAAMLLMLQFTVPRSVLIISPLLLIMIMGGSRLAYRGWKERRLSALMPAGREPVVVLGATESAASNGRSSVYSITIAPITTARSMARRSMAPSATCRRCNRDSMPGTPSSRCQRQITASADVPWKSHVLSDWRC